VEQVKVVLELGLCSLTELCAKISQWYEDEARVTPFAAVFKRSFKIHLTSTEQPPSRPF
jgi:hypothetical protein